MTVLNHEDIKNILIGATFMASGGGGPLDLALSMLEQCKEESVTLYDSSILKEGEQVVVVAAMGQPEAIKEQDFGSILNHTYSYIKEQAKKSDKNIVGCVPVEYGGFNTFAPIYLALQHPEIRLLDADGAGRAVPGLDTTFLALKQCSLTPMTMADEAGDNIFMDTAGNIDTSFMENVCRSICTEPLFGSISGLAGWIMDRETLQQAALEGDLKKALRIGLCLRTYQELPIKDTDVFSYMQKTLGKESEIAGTEESSFVKCIGSNQNGCTCRLVDAKKPTKEEGTPGFDVSTFTLEITRGARQPEKWLLRYINETLEIEKDGVPFMTAPDIICMVDDKTGMPLSNDYISKNWSEFQYREVSFGIMKVNEKWLDFTASMNEVWRKYFDKIQYYGDCIYYPGRELD